MKSGHDAYHISAFERTCARLTVEERDIAMKRVIGFFQVLDSIKLPSDLDEGQPKRPLKALLLIGDTLPACVILSCHKDEPLPHQE